MQEQVTQKTMALSIKTAKISGTALQAAMRQFLKMYRKQRDTPKHGKQTLKQLMRHGTGVSNIEITDANIKAFSQTAKKYGIDFALKKADDRYKDIAEFVGLSEKNISVRLTRIREKMKQYLIEREVFV